MEDGKGGSGCWRYGMDDGVLLRFFLFGGKGGQHGKEMEMFLQRKVRRELQSAFAMYVPSAVAFLSRQPWYDSQRL